MPARENLTKCVSGWVSAVPRDMASCYDTTIRQAVEQCQTASGGVYTSDLIDTVGVDRQVICRWLKQNGYAKPGGGTTKYWVPV